MRFKLGEQKSGSGKETQRVVKHLQSPLGIMRIARSDGIFGHGNRSKSFAKHVAALAERGSFGRYGEEHVAVFVETMSLYKVDCRFGRLQPLGVPLNMVVGIGTDIGKPPLKPHRFGRVHQGAVTIQAGVNTAIHRVNAVFHPKRHDVLREIRFVAVGPLLQISFGIKIHCRCPLKLIALTEKVDGFKFGLHTCFLFVGHILEWHTIRP